MATTKKEKKKSLQEVYQEKSERVLEGVAYWASFYRKNPQRFVLEYLNVKLKLFQKILIYMMMVSTNFMYIASRGSGKTWLTSLYCVVRCILYPGTKICVASGYKSQSLEVIQKINDDFMKNYGWGSANLRSEISEISTSINNAHVDFRNGSWIKIVSSNDSARHNRATLIVVDELGNINVSSTVAQETLYTKTQFIKDVQKAIGAGVDGKAGRETLSKTVTVSATTNRKHAVVKPIQKYLNSKGFNCGTVDGCAGSKFDATVKAYQRANGCIVDGVITAKGKTWKKLLGLA